MKTKLLNLFLLCALILTSGFGCKLTSSEVQEAMQPVTLEYWRVWDGPDAFEELIAKYNAIHSNIKINYKKLRYDEYEEELLNALAEDRGPDIFSIHNTWVMKYKNKIEPMPKEITLAYPVTRGTIKKEVVPELRTQKSLTTRDIRNNFIDVVGEDVIVEDKDEETGVVTENIYGLPLSVDTLALFYNKDLLNNAGIAQPPKTWVEIQKAVKALTKQNAKGELIQSGIALGGSKNIDRYSDILSVLMMQNLAQMTDDNGNVTFDIVPPALRSVRENPGVEALRFYSDFANPIMEVYSWNSTLTNSINLFAQGKLAMVFGYSYHLPTIEAQNPKLNFGVAPLPQIEDNPPINFANYWIETVSNKSQHKSEAWDFVQFIAKADQVTSYLNKTKKPTALRNLISEQSEDEDIGIFVDQLLTSESWYRGQDSSAMEEIFASMIDSTVKGEDDIRKIIERAATQVQQTIKK